MWGFEIGLRSGELFADHRAVLEDAVGVRALRLRDLTAEPLLPVPAAERGSRIAQDDDRGMAARHGDFAVEHQANSRLFSAFDHLAAHSEGWLVKGQVPPFHIYPEFTVLRGALEAAAAVWWILEPDDSRQRVLRTLASKKQEADHEAKAAKLKVGAQSADEFRLRIDVAFKDAANEIGTEAIPKFPSSTNLVDSFGGLGYGPSVGIAWRECSSYAHGFDWAAWHHREGEASSRVPFLVLAQMFVVACDALNEVWTRRWLPLALANPAVSFPGVFLPYWPVEGEPVH